MFKKYTTDEIETIINGIKDEKAQVALELIKEQRLRLYDVTSLYLHTKWGEKNGVETRIKTDENTFALYTFTSPNKRTISLSPQLFNKLKKCANKNNKFSISENRIRQMAKESAKEQGFKDFALKDLIHSMIHSDKQITISEENEFKHLVPDIPLAPISSKKKRKLQIIESSIPTDFNNTFSNDDKKENDEKVVFEKFIKDSIMQEENTAQEQARLQRRKEAILKRNNSIQKKYEKYNLGNNGLDALSIFHEAEDLYNHMILVCKAENKRMVRQNYKEETQNELNLHMKKMMTHSFWSWLIKRCNNNYFLATIIFQYIEVDKNNNLYDNIDAWYVNELIYGNNA